MISSSRWSPVYRLADWSTEDVEYELVRVRRLVEQSAGCSPAVRQYLVGLMDLLAHEMLRRIDPGI